MKEHRAWSLGHRVRGQRTEAGGQKSDAPVETAFSRDQGISPRPILAFLKPVRHSQEEIMNLVFSLYIHVRFRAAGANFVVVFSLEVSKAILAE